MNANELHYDFHKELQKEDSETQTFGCRANNPNICRNNGLSGICAFVTEDKICRMPTKAWKKQYEKLTSTNKQRND